jgi:hypothetical protein
MRGKKEKTGRKRIELHLPLPKDHPVVGEMIVVPVHVDPVAVEPLAAKVVVPCVLTLKETFWQRTPYIVLTAAPNCVLPEELKTGQQVLVEFAPITGASPPTPHD